MTFLESLRGGGGGLPLAFFTFLPINNNKMASATNFLSRKEFIA